MPDIVAFVPELLPAWAGLHNACFATAHNFWRVDSRHLRARVVNAPGFDPDLLLFARDGTELLGVAHGGLSPRGPELFYIGVHPTARRGGLARALVSELARRVGAPRPDCRGMNPFWGTARGPETSFFGMVEGIGAAADDAAARGFFAACGFTPGPSAHNLRVTPATLDLEPGRDARRRAEMLGYEFGLMRGRCPVVGAGPEQMRPLAGRDWFSTVALHGGTVAGVAVGFATPELGPGRFGVFALEVDPAHRRRGLGSALVNQLLLDMQGGPFAACEVTTVPDESPGALELYERLGFAACARFTLWA